jgi:hypothetical protein
VRRVLGQALERRDDHRLDAAILDGSRRPRARIVPQAVQPACREAVTPLADGGLIHSEARRHLLALLAFRAGQHDARPHRQRLRRLAPSRQTLKLQALALAENDLRRASPICHAVAPSPITRGC